ncbi:apolipoprotein N-acyltransferase [uncultured Maricaulis sp.]|uniref:apolipoprotein N-acyltransferase n=1 Tax=uncultured Maricaulis sp. TaxID=174710 RepID=UPI0030DB68F1
MTRRPWYSPGRLRSQITAVTGWPLVLMLGLSGALSSLAMAPFHIWPLLIASLAILLWSVDGARRRARPLRAAFWRGFLFGFGYFLVGMFWLANAFINRGPEYIPLIPIALPALAALLAAFWGGAMATYAGLAQRSEWRILVFAICIGAFEWLRGHMFGGLPWNLPAYAWPAGGAVSQAASWFGVYGLSMLTVLTLASPAIAVGSGLNLRRLMPAMAGAAILLILFSFGALRLQQTDPGIEPGVRLRIVQSALTQAEKWGEGGALLARDRYLSLTRAPGLEDVTHVLWPEGALPTYMLEDGATLSLIGEILGDDQVLMAGVNRRAETDEGETYHNSLAVLRYHGGAPRIVGLYDKVLLAPFGESIPFSGLLSAIGFADFARLQFTPGAGPFVMDVPGAPPVMPLICYEGIFPGFVRGGSPRPAWLFNLSNDAWFGDTSGPRQHVNQTRYRSIETGLPMIRSASRGVSGVIDALGRMPVAIEPGAQGAYDVDLPRPIGAPLYAFWGDWPFWVFTILVIAGTILQRRKVVEKYFKFRL